MAGVLDEPAAEACSTTLAEAAAIVVSAATVAEALIVAECRNVGEVAPVMEPDAIAIAVAAAYARWGKGIHRAGLNYGDCFAYALARQRGGPLLFVGDDFAKTDVMNAR
jgi:ribonuclease VapC